jgi:hypothetical protein
LSARTLARALAAVELLEDAVPDLAFVLKA